MTTDPHLTLHQLFSPAFPVGAFAYSHGAEAAVQAGMLQDAAGVETWLRDVLEHGSGWSDAVLLAQAAQGGDLAELAALARALTPSAERRLETEKQGAAFAATLRDVWGANLPDMAYPLVCGRAVALLDLPLADALRLYLQAFAANITAACVRLVPLGQTDGQRITHALAPLCVDLAGRAQRAGLDDIGGFTPMVDIMGQRHGALYSRIFRS
ncbi:urease accessory UreF family protein [Mesobacterium sp. TK19101]|uniref:Urease accessory protein UreF n=1 Tax=Mesobacterium hydrothermale TaxID=3111907 RepID=A0ABU6HEX4_9RHOB|nr:urease accessory UreF family protein [Mesobacterium sp. TK19101]MEC3861019.1 urease accessory UreF family protein [Mesobacterium sp. TK19101]